MGMSSSQARLLSLTARQHDVELKAQKLQAEKLQMANDSDRVYNTYLTALNSTKIQARISDNWEGDTFQDATLSMLVDGMISADSPFYDNTKTYAATPMFLRDTATGKLIVTKAYADANGITENNTFTGSLTDWLIDKGAPTKPVQYISGYNTVTNKNSVTNFTAVGNSFREFSYNYSYTPVANSTDPTFDEEELAAYAEFDNTHNTSVSGVAVSSVSSFTSGQTYTISSAADLQKLLELSATESTTGVNFVMTKDIDMKGVTDWSGIKNFEGTFDGNGYKISNLTGTQGLFDTTSGAEIKNIGLENIDIDGNSDAIGGLIGKAVDTNISNAYTMGNINNTSTSTFSHDATEHEGDVGTGGLVGFYFANKGKTTTIENVYSATNVTTSGYNAGGVLGCYFIQHGTSYPNINNVYSIGNVTGTTNVGGIAGYWKVDPDNHSNTDASNIYSGGDITGTENVGGFVGVLSCWDDNEDTFSFTNITTTSKVSGTTNEGVLIGENNAVTSSTDANFINCGYGAGINPGMDMVGKVSSGTATIPDTGGGGVESFVVAGKIPSASGLASNLIAAMIKAGEYDPYTDTDGSQKAQIEAEVNSFLSMFNDNDTDNKKLYYLNDKLVSYLNGTDDAAFAEALVKDIQNGTTGNTAAYQTGADMSGKIKRQTDDQSWEATFNDSDGYLKVANKETIKANLMAAVKMAGSSITESDIEAFLSKYDTTNDQDLAYLARVNDIIEEYSQTQNSSSSFQKLLSNVISGTKLQEMNPKIDNLDNYIVVYNTTAQSPRVTYGTTQEPQYATRQEIDYDDAKTQQLIKDYYAQQNGYIIIGDDANETGLCDSTVWLTNMINTGRAIFVTMDLDMVTKEASLRDVSVANETSLQEVSNTDEVKKAEATYEKDMKKINKKETKIDTELQELEAERTSIKTEQDSLKTIIKDNVDLTFKLFS